MSYDIIDTEVNLFPTGVDIAWSDKKIGWGHVTFGLRDVFEDWKLIYAGKWYADTECMSEEFVTAVIVKAAPQIAELIMKAERDENEDEKDTVGRKLGM